MVLVYGSTRYLLANMYRDRNTDWKITEDNCALFLHLDILKIEFSQNVPVFRAHFPGQQFLSKGDKGPFLFPKYKTK